MLAKLRHIWKKLAGKTETPQAIAESRGLYWEPETGALGFGKSYGEASINGVPRAALPESHVLSPKDRIGQSKKPGETVTPKPWDDREGMTESNLSEIYGRYVSELYRYIRTSADSDEAAKELTELTFMRFAELYRNRTSREGEHAYGAETLYMIAQNTLVDHYRGATSGHIDAEARWTPSYSRPASDLIWALQALPHHYREILEMRIFQDVPAREVAKRIGKSERYVRVVLHRALKELRRKLLDQDEIRWRIGAIAGSED